MPPRRLRMALIKCGNCGKRYSNPLAHNCPPRSTRSKGKTKVAPKVGLEYTCPACGKQASNPLTHVCQSKRGDFKRRKKAAAARERKARRDANRHEPRECTDEFCNRYPCKVYKQGFADGNQAGYSAGYDAGKADGRAEAQAESG